MGYNPSFLPDRHIPLPTPSQRVIQTAFNNGEFVHHLRYSILFNERRGLASCTAHNIDGNSLAPKQYTTRSFRFDPLIKPNTLQIDRDRGYSGESNKWDQGHLV